MEMTEISSGSFMALASGNGRPHYGHGLEHLLRRAIHFCSERVEGRADVLVFASLLWVECQVRHEFLDLRCVGLRGALRLQMAVVEPWRLNLSKPSGCVTG